MGTTRERTGSNPRRARIEDPAEWTPEKIVARAKALTGDKGPAGDFSD